MTQSHMSGWVHALSEEEFGAELQKVLSPSRAIQSPEFLRGRAEHLDGIGRAWHASGRQMFIHGYRGVGKTSLAQTAAFQRQSSDNQPVILACSRGVTFYDIIFDMLGQALPKDPRVLQQVVEQSAGIASGALSAQIKSSVIEGQAPKPKSINEALQLTAFLASAHSSEPVIIIDEFDQLESTQDQEACLSG